MKKDIDEESYAILRTRSGDAWRIVWLPRISTLARGTVHTVRRTRMSACSGGTRQFYMPTQELDIQSESGHMIIDTPGRYRLHGRLTLPMLRGRWCRSDGRFLQHHDEERHVECLPLESHKMLEHRKLSTYPRWRRGKRSKRTDDRWSVVKQSKNVLGATVIWYQFFDRIRELDKN